MELRDYQKKQLEFLNSHKSSFNVFDETISLQSPTGSGKSFVMLSFVKDYFKDQSGSRVFISTGFNELVYQFYNSAKDMGIDVEMLIGKEHATCYRKISSDKRYDKKNTSIVFDKNIPVDLKCNRDDCTHCRFRGECLYNKLLREIKDRRCTSGELGENNKLVITNHSTLLSLGDIFSSFNGGFVDECQSFCDFYERFKSIDISYKKIGSILEYLYSHSDPTDINAEMMRDIVDTKMQCGSLTPKLFNKLLEVKCLSMDKTYKLGDKFKLVRDKMISASEIDQNSVDAYFHPQIHDGRFRRLKIDRFFDKVNVGANVCLVSATVDTYTKNIFSCSDSYVEESCNIIDYSKSSIEFADNLDEVSVSRFLSKQTAEHGLFLSTRLDIVDEYAGKDICGYKFIRNIEEFVNGERQILIGSKRLFQGVDIGSVGFVMINKIPFPRYDFSYKKRMLYFDAIGHNGYKYYAVPYTVNQLTQSMGRLWRNEGDYGNIIIFDLAAVIKHRDLVTESLRYRDGIQVNWD